MHSLVDRKRKFLIDSPAKFRLLGSKILLLEVTNRSHPYLGHVRVFYLGHVEVFYLGHVEVFYLGHVRVFSLIHVRLFYLGHVRVFI